MSEYYQKYIIINLNIERMKMKINILVLLLIVAVGFTSCKKEESTIKGQITYIGAITGIEYYADGAEVYLYYGTVDLDNSPTRIVADANGNFEFNNLTDGNWQIYAVITVNGLNYEGLTTIVYTTGDDIQIADLVLE